MSVNNSISKVLVTGASGFVGVYVTKALIEKGYAVKGTYYTGDSFDRVDGVEYLQLAIDADTEWGHLLSDIDVIVHLAARAHVVKETSNDPLSEFRRLNVDGTRVMAEAAVRSGVKRIIFLSSVGVNGEVTFDEPFTEETKAHPEADYAVSKWEAEKTLSVIASDSAIEVVALRSPLVYGAGVKGNFLRLLKMTSNNVIIPLPRLDNKRSFIYAGNLSDIILKCLDFTDLKDDVFLVCDGQDMSTTELMDNIAGNMKKNIYFLPISVNFLKFIAKTIGKSKEISKLTSSLRIDKSRLALKLDWTPPYTVEEGIAEMVDWYMESRK